MPLVTKWSHTCRAPHHHSSAQETGKDVTDGRFNIGAVSINPVKFALKRVTLRQLRQKNSTPLLKKYSLTWFFVYSKTGDTSVSETYTDLPTHSSGVKVEHGNMTPWPTVKDPRLLVVQQRQSVAMVVWSDLIRKIYQMTTASKYKPFPRTRESYSHRA